MRVQCSLFEHSCCAYVKASSLSTHSANGFGVQSPSPSVCTGANVKLSMPIT